MNKKKLYFYREGRTTPFFEVANGEMGVKFAINKCVLVRKGGMEVPKALLEFFAPDTPKEHGRHVPEPRLRFK